MYFMTERFQVRDEKGFVRLSVKFSHCTSITSVLAFSSVHIVITLKLHI